MIQYREIGPREEEDVQVKKPQPEDPRDKVQLPDLEGFFDPGHCDG